MKTVLKCDFCHHTENYHEDKKMIEHEKACCLNPITKGCYTCIHYEDIGMPISGEMPHCKTGENASDVLFHGTLCGKHETKT